MLYDTSRSRRVHICGALRSRAKALHPDVRNTPDPLYISYIDFSISDTYSEYTKGMELRLPPEFIKRIRQGGDDLSESRAVP